MNNSQTPAPTPKGDADPKKKPIRLLPAKNPPPSPDANASNPAIASIPTKKNVHKSNYSSDDAVTDDLVAMAAAAGARAKAGGKGSSGVTLTAARKVEPVQPDPVSNHKHMPDHKRYKTVLCMHFTKNRCQKGDACNFAHGEWELRALGEGCENVWKLCCFQYPPTIIKQL